MDHYCEICVKSITNKFYIIDNPNFFDIEKIFKVFMTNHSKKI